MSNTELRDTLDEMITYYMCCWNNAQADSKARKMFDRYIEALRNAHRIVGERMESDGKKQQHHD